MKLADVEVARTVDFGKNDDRIVVRSHLGAILRPGNKVLGYDLRWITLSGADEEQLEAMRKRADVFLVRKVYNRKRGRAWGLQRLKRDQTEGGEDVNDNEDMEALKQEL